MYKSMVFYYQFNLNLFNLFVIYGHRPKIHTIQYNKEYGFCSFNYCTTFFLITDILKPTCVNIYNTKLYFTQIT